MNSLEPPRSRKHIALCFLLEAISLASCGSPKSEAVTSAQETAKSSEHDAAWTIERNGSFDALFGMFVLHQGKLHVYSQLERVLNAKTGRKEYVPDSDELESSWKGEEYYHEIYDLVDGVWVQKRREFAHDLDDASTFDRCDPKDRRDIPLPLAMKRELPSPIKIKAVHEAPGLIAVVYTDSSQPATSVFGTPPIEVDLLVPDKNGWRVAASEEVDEYGTFCRATAFNSVLARGEPATVLLVFTDDLRPTSESFSANSFLLRKSAK